MALGSNIHCPEEWKMENPDQVNRKRIISVYSDFMIRVTQFDDLVSMGSRLLVGFQQALGFLRRPPIEKKSTLVEHIIKAHGSRRVLSYVEAGHVKTCDRTQNVSKSKIIVSELKCLLDDAAFVVQTVKGKDEDDNYTVHNVITLSDEEEMSLSYQPDVTDYATMMAIIYSMLKQDYTIQVRIVSSLDHTPSPGEMETYCQLWSLRPFIDDDMMLKAWKLSS